MPRIAGVDIPPAKRIEFSLRYIHGIGPNIALDVLKEAQIEVGVKAKDLTEAEVARIGSVIERVKSLGAAGIGLLETVENISSGGGLAALRTALKL